MKKINFLITKPDLKINIDKFGKNSNILFVTGLVGAGKTYTSKIIAKEKNATWINQDWFAWSDKHDDELCKYFINLFQKKYPETIEYIEKCYFRDKNKLTKEIREQYLHKFENIIMDYVKDHPKELFIYEGSDIFLKTESIHLKNKPLIIKRTSIIRCLLQVRKRNKDDINFNLKKLVRTYKKYHTDHLKKLNNFIKDYSM